jgi:nucleotide-binding universal stress UspA family protein
MRMRDAGGMTSEPEPLADLHVRNILVALDGSESALRALPTARALARRVDADVRTISAARNARDAAGLRKLASRALDADLIDDHVVVVHGDPAEAIEQQARTLAPCVVCLTTRSRGRFHGAVVGSVARSLLQRSSDPIVALGPMADNPGWSPRPRNWPEPLSVPRLVACVDGSETSEQVLPLAATWARTLEMSLTIVTITGDATASTGARDKDRYGSHADAESYLAQLVQHWHRSLPETDGEVVRSPIGIWSAIRMYLDRRPAGLVALTTHARSGTRRAFLGATAANIVHASVAPCLVAPVPPMTHTERDCSAT